MKYWNKVYDAEVAETSDVMLKENLSEYERMAKQHDNRQPFIESELIEAIKAYNCVTYRALATHINNWCIPRRHVAITQGHFEACTAIARDTR